MISIIKDGLHYDYCIDCDPKELKKWVEASVKHLEKHSMLIDEYVQECYGFFWILIFRKLNKEMEDDVPKIRKFLEMMKLKPRGSVHQAIVHWTETASKSTNATVSVASGILTWLTNLYRVEFKDAQAEAATVLKGKTLVILIDSPEDYALRGRSPEIGSGGELEESSTSVTLFRALTFASATFQPSEIRLTVKYFIPVEVYGFLSQNPVNWGKTAGSILGLRWKPSELLCLVAKRLRFFRFRSGLISAEFVNMRELDDPRLAYLEWIQAFSEQTQNLVHGITENTFLYVLRHTQLMPRQVISCGNSILNRLRGNLDDLPASESYVRSGIDSAETDNAKDSLELFSQVHGDVFRIGRDYLTHMPCTFSYGTLQSELYPAIAADLSRILGLTDFREFLRLLAELGIIGVARPDLDTATYRVAVYEHEIDDVLRIQATDTLYVHPMFLKHLSIARNRGVLERPICGHSALDGFDSFGMKCCE